MYLSARQQRRNDAEEAFRALMVGVAEQPIADGERLAVWPTWGGAHGYAFRQGVTDMDEGESVHLSIQFIGVTAMVAWSASGYVRSIQSADGYIALKKATPAGVVEACRACLAAHRANLAAERERQQARSDLHAEAKAALGFWLPEQGEFRDAAGKPNFNDYYAAQRAFAFHGLTVRRSDSGLRYRVDPQPLDNLTAAQVVRLKAFLDAMAEEASETGGSRTRMLLFAENLIADAEKADGGRA